MHDPMRRPVRAVLPILAVVLLSGCQSLREMAALRQVQFDFGGVSDVRVAGIDFTGVRSLGDLGALDAARLAATVARGELPVRFDLGVLGTNPADNATTARLVRLDWTLFLEGKETISGLLDTPIALPAGETVEIPVGIELDLLRFFDSGAADLVRLVAGMAGVTEQTTSLRLEATPTIDSPLGPIRYPRPIAIVNTESGE